MASESVFFHFMFIVRAYNYKNYFIQILYLHISDAHIIMEKADQSS